MKKIIVLMTLGVFVFGNALAADKAPGKVARSKFEGVEIHVLSDRSADGLLQPLFEAFEAATGIEVEPVFMDEGLVERLESRKVEADVVITKDAELMEVAKRKELLAKYDSDKVDKAVPQMFRDKDGEYFVDAYRLRGIVVSKDRVKQGAIKEYADLAKPEWKGKVCTRSGKHDYNIALFGQMMKAWGDEKAKQLISNIAANLAVAPNGDDREQAKQIMEGKCDVALLNSYYYPRMFEHASQTPWGKATRYVFPDQGGEGAFMMRSAVGIAKQTEDFGASQMLLEFIASVPAQKLTVERTKQYPVLEGVAPHKTLVEMAKAQGIASGKPKVHYVPLDGLADKREEAIKFVESIGYDAGPKK